MPTGPFVFVDIDTQRDFLETSGALYIPGSERILSQLAKLTEFARTHEIPVIATACAHHEDDREFEVFPPHCLVGSEGQTRIDATAWSESLRLGEGDRLKGPIPSHLTIEKTSYDVFGRSDANQIFEQYTATAPTFVVYGVATDYCVACAVSGLRKLGYKVALVVDAVWPIDREAEAKILTEFARAGVLLTLTSVVCDDR